MEIKDRINGYFNFSKEEKDTLLVDISQLYIDVLREKFNNQLKLKELLSIDIQIFEETEQFEAAQALTDILNHLIKIEKEYKEKNGLQL